MNKKYKKGVPYFDTYDTVYSTKDFSFLYNFHIYREFNIETDRYYLCIENDVGIYTEWIINGYNNEAEISVNNKFVPKYRKRSDMYSAWKKTYEEKRKKLPYICEHWIIPCHYFELDTDFFVMILEEQLNEQHVMYSFFIEQ